LLSLIQSSLRDLDHLEAQHRTASDKSQTLHVVCRRLLAEQAKLDKVVQEIETPLQFFKVSFFFFSFCALCWDNQYI